MFFKKTAKELRLPIPTVPGVNALSRIAKFSTGTYFI